MASQLYKLFCKSENQVVYDWNTSTPTLCPNNSYHSIAADSVRLADDYKDIAEVKENSDGYFETTHIVMNVPTGSPGDIVTHDVTWPMDILLWRTLLTQTSDMNGDSISVVAAPETTVAVLTATVNVGDTVLNVNSTANIERGFLITLDDGTNKDVLGRCTAVDSGAGTITVETATSYSYVANDPVKISIYILKDIDIVNTETMDIGSKGFKGKTITQGTILRIYYTNNSGTSKTVRWRPELYALG